MIELRYRLTLLEPAILAALDGEPNSAVSHDYVPGSVARGLAIGAYTRRHGQVDPVDPDARRLFFSSATRFLNATLILHTAEGRQHRPLPVPRTWQREKHDNSTVYDAAIARPRLQEPKSVDGYVALDNQTAFIAEPERVLNVHLQRPRRGGIEGELYRYAALAADQQFEGVIICDSPDDAQTLQDLLGSFPNVRLGKARSAGYGSAKIEMVSAREITYQTTASTPVILTLHSNTILRDGYGQYAPNLTTLLWTLETLGLSIPAEAVVLAALDTTMVGGFNRKWGLPLPQTAALKQGSVLVLRDVQFNAEQLYELLRFGIGERRNEGFGQVAINWQQNAEYPMLEAATRLQKEAPESEELSDQAKTLWRRIERHQFEKDRDAVWIEVVAKRRSNYAVSGKITKTQLARLRIQIADALRGTQRGQRKHLPDVIGTFLKDIQGKAAGDQYNNARIMGKPLSEWLRNPYFPEMGDAQPSSRRIQLKMIDAVLEWAVKDKEREARDG